MLRKGTYAVIFKAEGRWQFPYRGLPGWFYNSYPVHRNVSLERAELELNSCMSLVRRGEWLGAQIIRTS